MRAYYVINDNGEFYRSETIEIPEGIDGNDIITYVHGVMFESAWSPGTPYAIYLNRGSGYEPIAGDDDFIEELYSLLRIGCLQDNT